MEKLRGQSYGEFISEVLTIGTPVLIQSILGSFVNMVAVFMIGQLGEVAITATAMGNQWFQLFALLANGFGAAGSMFIAQYWGKRDTKSIHQFMGILIYTIGILTIFFMTTSFLAPDVILRFYSKDPLVIKEGMLYLRTISCGFLLFSVTSILVTALRSMGITKLPMYASATAVITNGITCYILIFGKFGFPAMGIQGAALATVIARIVELTIILIYVYKNKLPVYGKPKKFLVVQKSIINKYVKYGSFVILGEVAYAIGNNLYNVAYKYTGTESQAALQIVGTFQGLSLVICSGIGTAAAVMIGTRLGQDRFDEVKVCCKRLIHICLIISVCISCILIITAPFLLRLFQLEDTTKSYASIMIRILAVSIPLKAIVYLSIVGILRSGGDSGYCFVANLFGVWCVGLPLVFLSAVYFKWPIYYVYIMAMAEEMGKFIICFPRVLRYKWMRNLT